MYTEIIIRPLKMAGQRVFGQDARRMVAKAMEGKQVPPLFFGRDSDGKTLGTRVNKNSPLAQVVFDGGAGFLRVYGIGQEGSALVTQQMGNIVSSIADYTDGAVSMDLRNGSIAFKGGYRFYRVGKLALAKHGKVRGEKFFKLHDRYRAAATDEDREKVFREAEEMIRFVINRDIGGMAEQIGNIDVPRNLGIVIHSGELSVARIHPGDPGHVGIIKNLRFSMVGDLVGPWSVGHLRAYGFGLLKTEEPK